MYPCAIESLVHMNRQGVFIDAVRQEPRYLLNGRGVKQFNW
jgi:hypothetical protein